MENEISLTVAVKDEASDTFAKIAKKAKDSSKILQDAFNKNFDLKKIDLLENNRFNQLSWAVGSEMGKNIVKGIKAGFDISNEMTSMMGKLRMALDAGTSVNAALADIEQAANQARMPMEDLTNSVAKFGLTSGQYFDNTELINFTKSLASYASLTAGENATNAMSQAMYQLQQAFSKGKMQMDDLKPIMNSMPGIANELANALGISVAELQEMTSAGEFTSDKIKQAFIGMSSSVQERLDQMPKTFDQRMNGIRNSLFAAKKAVGSFFQAIAESRTMQVILGGIELAIKKIVVIINKLGDTFKKVFRRGKDDSEDLSKAINTFANVAIVLFLGLAAALTVVSINFVIMGVKALLSGLAAQIGWWPVTLIFLGIVIVIAALIGMLTYLGYSFSEVAEVIGMTLGGAIAFVINALLAMSDIGMATTNYLGRTFTMFANFFGNIFNDPIAAIINGFRELANSILSILRSIAKAIDRLFGSNLAGAVQGWMNGVDDLADKAVAKMGNGKYQGKEWRDISLGEITGIDRVNVKDWSAKGASVGKSFGEGLESSVADVKNLFGSDLLGTGGENIINDLTSGTDLSDYDASTGSGSLSTALNEDSIDELKAFAEIQYRLSYKQITPNVNIKFGDVRETANLDDITAYIKKMMNEDLEELYIMEGGQ